MTRYQLSHENWVTKQPDDVRFSVGSADSQNPDYLEYMAWLAAGNIPDPPSAEHRAIIRERLHAARRAARTAAETSGFVYNGHPFDSDRDSILRIANAATTALTANLVGAPFATEWHCADGYDMPLDAAGVMAMQGALAAHGQACHDRSSALRAMIEDPEADLDALAEEIKTGWPGEG
jgi:hypothetical protein